MALQIRVARPQLNGTFIIQPNITKASGHCGETKANLTLSFKEGFITFLFTKSTDNTTSYVDAVSFNLTYAFVKGKEENFPAKNNTLHLFSAKVGRCYSCRQTEQVLVEKGLYLDVSQDQFQGFNLTKSKEFGLPDRCPADQPDYKVAIGVGVTLLVLIVIVVVAYLVTRKRRTDGYQAL
nr:lysosome-associated membrane glycoprotein 3 [Solea senegalensis]